MKLPLPIYLLFLFSLMFSLSRALKEVNFKGRAAIELAFEEPPVGSVREEWKKSREYVEKAFGW